MLATPATDNSGATSTNNTSMVAPPAPAPSAGAPQQETTSGELEELFNYLASPEFTASPEFKDLHSFSASGDFDMAQYLTSPLAPELADDFDSPEDTPFHKFLTTPLIQEDNHDFSAVIDYDHEPLFPDLDAPVIPAKQQLDFAAPPMDLDFEGLHTISPHTPMLDTPAMDPVSLYPAPRQPSTVPVNSEPAPPSVTGPRRRTTATGTRKGITPDSLVPLDAPTQPRKYVTPSATSRKELPAVFARKRARSEALGDEEDELDNEKAPGPNATEREQIEWKRRQNTLAARKSRKRKLQHQQELEDSVKALTTEKEVWKTRALTFRQLLVSHGIPFNEFQD